MNDLPQQPIRFAEFELDTARRLLQRHGKPLALNAKALDLLIFLTENAGRIVTKNEILDAVWENQFVEEANLKVQISALRKVLGERKDEHRFLVTIPGKGYKFVAEIQNGNGEIVIEKHKISRVIVEAETEIESPQSSGKLANRINYGRWLGLGSLAIIALVGVLWGIYQYFQSKKNQLPFEKIKLTRLTNNGKIEAATASSDGNFIAYVLGEAEGNSLWVRQVDAANDIRILPPVKAKFWEVTFTPDGKQIYYNLFRSDKTDAELSRIPTLGGVSQKMPNVISFGISFAPDGKRFAYIVPDSGSNHNYLVVADANGTNPQIIAKKPQPNTFVFDGDFTAWSPDGETIACLVNHLEADSNYTSIVGINLKDGTEKPIGSSRWQDVRGFQWLKNGSGLIVSGREQNSVKNQIWLLSLPSGEIRPITDDLNNYSWLNMSDNGDSIVALQNSTVNSIYVGETGVEAGKFKEITSEVNELNPFVWTPDGKIIFHSVADGVSNLWIMEADGTNRRQLTVDAKIDSRGMCLTPDGKYIVFTSWRSGKSNVWRADADGKNFFQLTNGEADAHPACTPDGQSVVYQRGILTQPSLWKVSINGGESHKLTNYRAKWGAISSDGKQISFFQMFNDKWTIGLVGAEGGEIIKRLDVPAGLIEHKIEWSPDDRSLFFMGANGNIGNLWSLPLNGSPPQPITAFNSHLLADFAWSADRRKLAVARRLIINDMILITNENKP